MLTKLTVEFVCLLVGEGTVDCLGGIDVGGWNTPINITDDGAPMTNASRERERAELQDGSLISNRE